MLYFISSLAQEDRGCICAATVRALPSHIQARVPLAVS